MVEIDIIGLHISLIGVAHYVWTSSEGVVLLAEALVPMVSLE